MHASQINVPPVGSTLDFSNPLTQCLKGCWLLNEQGGGAFNYTKGVGYRDLSPYHNNGILTCNDRKCQRTSQGVFMDGVDDTIVVPHSNSLDITDDLTISAWINPRDAGTLRAIVNHGFTDAGPVNYRFRIQTDNKLRFSWYNGGFQTFGAGKYLLNVGTWYHVLVRAYTDRVEQRVFGEMYVNANLDLVFSSTPVNKYFVTNTLNLQIGSIDRTQAGYEFAGYLNRVMIWDRYLSTEEIDKLYMTPNQMFLH